MIKTLQNALKQDREGFDLPQSVQDAIPIRRLWPDGIFQFGSKFSKTIRFTDIKTTPSHPRRTKHPCSWAILSC